jgi:D-3-phosphoglycerate dehydrogenase
MTDKKILFIDDAHPVLREELERDGWQCDSFPGYGREEFKEIIGDYTGVIIRSRIKLDEDFLSVANRLKFIARVGAGMEFIDTKFAENHGITCLNAPEGNRDAVGEQAVGMLLALWNNLLRADKEVRQGIWEREKNRGLELGGKTIGIIGYGNTGGAFARKLSGFGVRVLAYDKYKTGFSDDYVQESTLEEFNEYCDVVSLHVPLTEETTYMVDEQFISRFRKPFWLINTSRGEVVKTTDLVAALEQGTVSGACLDVLEYEGLSFNSIHAEKLPEAFRKLVQMENVILSPHIAGLTVESNYKLAMTIVEKIRKLF